MENKPLVLIVEDEADGRDMLQDMLDMWDINSECVSDAESAIDHLKANQYDAAIIDLALPQMDGSQLLQEIRMQLKLVDLPCIAVTAFDNNVVKHQSLKAGFSAYIPKPINDTLLYNALKQFL